MGNLHFAMLASPEKHKDLVREINKWKYEMEGEVAKGEVSPVIHEVKFYEVRCPDEIEAEFVRDLGLQETYDKFGTNKSLAMRVLYWIYGLIRFFSPYKRMDESRVGEEHKYKFHGTWHYAFPIGKLRRRKMKVKFGKDREVL